METFLLKFDSGSPAAGAHDVLVTRFGIPQILTFLLACFLPSFQRYVLYGHGRQCEGGRELGGGVQQHLEAKRSPWRTGEYDLRARGGSNLPSPLPARVVDRLSRFASAKLRACSVGLQAVSYVCSVGHDKQSREPTVCLPSSHPARPSDPKRKINSPGRRATGRPFPRWTAGRLEWQCRGMKKTGGHIMT